MKLALILATLASWSTGQLIYPDEFESMVAAATGRPQRLQADFAAVNNAFPSVGSGGFNTISSPPQKSAVQGIKPRDVISKGVLRFALNMDGAVATARTRSIPGSRENIIFSPLSVAATLAEVLLGSAGKTFQEVSTILGFNDGLDVSRNSEAVHRMFGTLISSVHGKPGLPTPESSFANGIFIRDGYPIRSEFRSASENIYNSEVINLAFQDGGGRAQKIVNDWVTDKTRGKIPNILNGPPPAETSIILASALYFNGEWNQHFIDGATRRKPFTVAPGETVMVDMMYNGGEFPFFEDKKLRTKIVGFPYKGREVTMYVLLPNDKGFDALRALEERLDPDTLENLISKTENRTCILGLPRMKLSSTLSLKDALQSLGLNSLFDPSTADLSLISSGYTGERYSGKINQEPNVGTQRPNPAGIDFPPRIGGDNEKVRQNFFTYDDKVRGYHVEQWSTGFSIGRIPTQKRRRSINPAAGRKWRNSEDKLERNRRQINQGSYNEIDNQNQPSYGIDYIRNNVNLVNPRLYADDVLHRVEMDIDEKGTVAAAATAVILNKDGSQKRLVADRPFLFFIRHEESGLILFWGSVNKPTPNNPSP